MSSKPPDEPAAIWMPTADAVAGMAALVAELGGVPKITTLDRG